MYLKIIIMNAEKIDNSLVFFNYLTLKYLNVKYENIN